jgi:Pex14 N-terminal domain
MAGSDDEKKAEIPAWQRSGISDRASPTGVAQEKTTHEADKFTLEAARKFLEDESIRNEPRDRKIAFLKEKGLQNEEIQSLLGYEKPAATSLSELELKTVHDSTTDLVSNEVAEPKEDPATGPTPPRTDRRDAPPIITYPEFLIRPQKPPPLVTAQRLIYAAYAFAGVSTLTYGASKFIIEPMLNTLTSAREELASTALQDLEKLNAKLETTVSHVPYILSSAAKKHDDPDDDEESISSDPTELFHRDIGIQTSPPRSRSSSTSSTDLKSKDPATRHASSLSSLLSNLKSLNPPQDDEDAFFPANSLKDTVAGLQTYLNTLQFSGSSFRTDYSSIYTSTTSSDNRKVSKAPGDTDEAAKLKAEIRALKGAFLSSRNFPGRPAISSIKG